MTSNTPHPYAGVLEQRRRLRAFRREAAASKGLRAAALVPVFQRYGIRRAYLFGSIGRGKGSPESDIDLYVGPVSSERYRSLWRDLESRAGESVDLYCQRDDPGFIAKIKQRGELIYEA